MTDTDDEFAYLPGQARRVGVAQPLPEVIRVGLDTAAGVVSALRWRPEHPAQVVFMHGAGLNAHTWDATALALGVPAIAFDLPGHGDSQWREDVDYSPETNARTLGEALALLGDDVEPGATIVGQSLGGLTAIELADRDAGRFGAVVLVDALPYRQDVLAGALQASDFLGGRLVFDSRDEIVDRALAFGFGPTRADVEQGVVLNTRVRDDGTVVYKHHLGNIPDGFGTVVRDYSALWGALGRIPVPVLLVRATRSPLTDGLVERFLETVGSTARAASEVVDIDAGHNVQEERPGELARMIGGVGAVG